MTNSVHKRRSKEQCSESAVCPACGGLECLCRPRFFAGQLLTEKDLNALDHYIVEKNKLHNRYLHGWGVVCGLEVVSNPCDGRVTVRPGYALSPCGEDIVVCRDDTVDVCDLIQQCRSEDRRRSDCDPPRPFSAPDCKESRQDWVLAICYDEKPSRGIAALLNQSVSSCCSRCNCGGSSSCGCGCHRKSPAIGNKHAATSGYHAPHRNTLTQCEPTMTCESFRYKVYKAPKPQRDDNNNLNKGALNFRFETRLRDLLKNLEQLPINETRPNSLYEWYCEFKNALNDHIERESVYDSFLHRKLAEVNLPNPQSQSPDNYFKAWENAVQQLMAIAGRLLQGDLQSTLLPRCPEQVESRCVPLATITVELVKGRCGIASVCNWGVRRFVVTPPNLGYWLSIIPIFDQLHQLVARLCHRPLHVPDVSLPNLGRQTHQEGSEFVAGKPKNAFSTLAFQAAMNRDRVVDVQTLLLGALGATDAQGRPYISNLEHNNSLPFLLLNQVGRPLVESLMPDLEARDIHGQRAADMVEATVARPERDEEIEKLRAELQELQKTLKAQQKAINALKKRSG